MTEDYDVDKDTHLSFRIDLPADSSTSIRQNRADELLELHVSYCKADKANVINAMEVALDRLKNGDGHA